MTTKHSPLHVLQAQANSITNTLKAAARGDKIDARYAEKIDEARTRGVFKVAVVMDDKVIAIDIPWATITASTEIALSEYILNLMRGTRDVVN